MIRVAIGNVLLIIVNLLHVSEARVSATHPVFVVIAFDGFRYDYLDRGFTPILKDLARNGSSAKYLLNQFPTITFPNFHSISTGMYPETHGVLGDSAFDTDGACISDSYELYHQNEDIVPLWMLNENSGNGRHSGVAMWVGSRYKYQNKLPTFILPYDPTVSFKHRVDKVMSWLTNETTPANLVFLYFEQPDEDGHEFGPDSDQVNLQLRKINLIMKYYLRQLSALGIRDAVNTIVLSDHGMDSVNQGTTLNLDDYIDPKTYSACGTSPGLQIRPKSGFEEEIYANLTRGSAQSEKFFVYKRENIPDRWHFKNNPRCASFFVEANLTYVFQDSKNLKGDHGYDNKELKMRPLFLAEGPLIKRNYTIQPFQNIDLYPFLSHVLRLDPPPTHVTPNGTLNNVQHILKSPNST